MTNLVIRLLSAAVAVLLLAVGLWLLRDPGEDSTNAARAATPSLDAVDCWFDSHLPVTADCAHWHSDGFQLPVVVIRDESPEHRADPLVYLVGGPGSGSGLDREGIESWYYWLEDADLARDLVLVDRRGTGLSEPRFRCHHRETQTREVLEQDLDAAGEQQALLEATRTCLERMRAAGHPLRDYGTALSARDMQGVMDALGYQRWNVMGSSYGSRLALAWLRRDDHRIRSVILDSVYPLDKGSLADWPARLDESFARFWRYCTEESELCAEEDVAQPRALLEAALDTLAAEPRQLSVDLWHGGWPLEAVLNPQRLVGLVYSALYNPNLYPHILRALREVQTGGSESLERLAAYAFSSPLDPQFNPMVYLAVDCAESWPVAEEDYRAARDEHPAWAEFTGGVWEHNPCGLFPRLDQLQAFKTPVQSDVPALILSGGLDPVTPTRWARELAARLDNSYHWHLPGVGHGVTASSPCVHGRLRSFLDELDDSGLGEPGEEHPSACCASAPAPG